MKNKFIAGVAAGAILAGCARSRKVRMKLRVIGNVVWGKGVAYGMDFVRGVEVRTFGRPIMIVDNRFEGGDVGLSVHSDKDGRVTPPSSESARITLNGADITGDPKEPAGAAAPCCGGKARAAAATRG